MESSSLEEGNIIKNVTNLFRLKKEIDDTKIKYIRNIFRQKKKLIKDRILRDIRNPFEHEEEENYCKPVGVSNFWSNNYIKYGSKGDRNKTLSAEKYLDKFRPHLKDIKNNLKKYDMWRIQLTIASNYISFIDNDEKRVMHSKCDNIEIMMNEEADKVIK